MTGKFDWAEYKQSVERYYYPIAEAPKEEDRSRVVGEATEWLLSREPNELREEFLVRIYGSLNRPGCDALMAWLDTTDFWIAPASTRFHESEPGGLVRHSLRVHEELVALHDDLIMRYPETYDRSYSPQTLDIVALFHDLCKVRYYAPTGRWRKDDHGQWYIKQEWTVHDEVPLGHGEKSLFYVMSKMGLTAEEAGAIRWHIGAYEPGVVHGYPTGYSHGAAKEKWPLVGLLQMADQIAQQRESTPKE